MNDSVVPLIKVAELGQSPVDRPQKFRMTDSLNQTSPSSAINGGDTFPKEFVLMILNTGKIFMPGRQDIFSQSVD